MIHQSVQCYDFLEGLASCAVQVGLTNTLAVAAVCLHALMQVYWHWIDVSLQLGFLS